MPWRELERRLSGRPRRRSRAGSGAPNEVIGDGGDSVAWSRHRPAYEAPALIRPTRTVPYAELHAHSSFSFLDGASLPGGDGRRGGRARAERAGAHRPRRDVRRRPVRRGGARSSAWPRCSAPSSPSTSRCPRTNAERSISARAGAPDPPGRHLLVLARDPTGYASLCRAISAAQRRGGAKGRPVYDLDELTGLADGHWLVLTGCRKGPVRTALESGGYGTFALDPARRALAELVDRFGRDNVVVELTYARDPLADERYDALAQLAAEQRPADRGHHGRALPRTAAPAARHRDGRGAGPAQPATRWTAGCRPGPTSSCAAVRRWPQRFARWPGAVETAARLGAELAFSLHLIAPDLPPFPVPPGHTEMTYLRELTARRRRRSVTARAGQTTSKAYDPDRARADDHRGAEVPRLLPGRLGHRPVLPATTGSCARAGDRPPTPRSVTPWRSPPSTPSGTS